MELHAPNETTVQNKLMNIKTKLLEQATDAPEGASILRSFVRLVVGRPRV